MMRGPLPSELGTNKPVKAIFWPWLEPFSVRKYLNPFKLFSARRVAGYLGAREDDARARAHDALLETRVLNLKPWF